MAERANAELVTERPDLQEPPDIQQVRKSRHKVVVKQHRTSDLDHASALGRMRPASSRLGSVGPISCIVSRIVGQGPNTYLSELPKTCCLFRNPADSVFSPKKRTDSIRHSIRARAVVQVVLQHFATGSGACVQAGGLKLKAAFNFR